MNREFLITHIGRIHSKLKNLDECPLQESEGAPEALLDIFPDFKEGLDGVVPGSRLTLLTWLHLADRTIIKCHRRNEINTPTVGVFTTRSPDRPNPIGIHHVKVLEITSEGLLKVFPLEVLDGTPIVDIKPFITGD